MSFNMVIDRVMWPQKNDAIFEIAGKAKAAISEKGKENVIDATLGALYDDAGNLLCMKSAFDTLHNLPNEKLAAYAPLAGTEGFKDAVIKQLFAGYVPEGYVDVVATPGGSGAVRHSIVNYTNRGDSILVPDWFWTPYKTISEEAEIGVENFTMFNDKGGFNIESFKEHFEAMIEKQHRLVTILNTPAHNPTGYSISDDEWDELLAIFKKAAENKENKIIIAVDTAYIDFAGQKDEKRKFFTKFSNLPENIFVTVCFSMSKGYTMYGMRSGAIVGISSNEDAIKQFHFASMHGGRGNWSNGTRGAMETMDKIVHDDTLFAAYQAELTEDKEMLQKRAKAFVEEAEKIGLPTLPYRDGFFITLDHDDPVALQNELTKYDLFLVALKKGVRFAICAVNEEKCRKAPAIIKKAMEALK